MKKKILMFVVALVALFSFGDGVSAAPKAKLDCSYSINFSGFGSAKDKNYTFHAIYYDNGSASITSWKSLTGSEDLGGLYITQRSGMEKDFIKYVKENNSCPGFYFEWDDNTNVLFAINLDSTDHDPSSHVYNAKKLGSTSETGDKEVEEKVICEKQVKAQRGESSWNVVFRFYEAGNKRRWSAASSLNDVQSYASVDGVASVGGHVYRLSDEIIKDVYDNHNCEKDPADYTFWLECVDTNSNNIILTKTKPEDSNNCSYGVWKAKKDNGKQVYKNPASGYKDNGKTTSSHWIASDGNTDSLLHKIWNMIRVLIPLLIIILSTVDFLKVVFISEEKIYKVAYVKFLKRVGVGIILLVIPSIVKLLLTLAGLQDLGIYKLFS